MRLGGWIFEDCPTPERWVAAARGTGYSAAYCPVVPLDRDDLIKGYVDAARDADIVIAEMGAWSNPLSGDEETRRKALALNRERLELADKFGARCCVNISGSRGAKWDGPHPDNLTEETFEMIVETVRGIIDAVKPRRTFYTLEPMPWMYPDSAESYLRLIRAIDRKRFAVHLDPVNLISSPQAYFGNGALIRECFAKLGRYIKSCHAKDIRLSEKLTTHLDEVGPGMGALDYRAYLGELDKLDPDTPLLIEHLTTREEFVAAAAYIRSVAAEIGVNIH
jgi:sugar phosphate isomerase/epimerase